MNEETRQRILKIQYAPADIGGTSFHWCRLPAKLINDSGLAEAQVERQFDFDTDILVIQRQVNPVIIPALKRYQDEGGVVIYWLEDQVFLLPMTSPVRTEYFNKTQQGIEKIVEVCDGVTCSSKPLANYLSRFNKNVHVLPHIMLKKWATMYQPEVKRKDKEVRILWTTTAHHKHDFPIIEHALKDIATKYPNVKILLWGFITKNIVDMVPRERLEFYGWVPIDNYFECLTAMEADIGIAPLDADNIYNKAKTNLKWLEYGLMKYAPVVSDCLPYVECVEDGKTGLIVKNNKHKEWVNALSSLIEDAPLRKKLGNNAYKYVMKHHTEDRIHDYLKIYGEVYGKRKKATQGVEKEKDSS